MDYPESLRPMEPRSRPKPFNDPGYLFQIKWDGVRYLAFIRKGKLTLQSRHLKMKTHLYPELNSLTGCLGGKSGVLDGEIIAPGEGGRPSFPQVLRRDLAREASFGLVKQVPVCFMVFDFLFLDEKNLMPLALEERLALLQEEFREDSSFHLTGSHQLGLDLFHKAEEQGLEGMVAKKRRSPYRAGQKTDDWLKVKVVRRQDCLVGGYVLKAGRVSSLMVGAYQDDKLLYLGKVSSGLKEAELEALHRELFPYGRATPPFVNPPPLQKPLEGVWLEPTLGVEVLFAEWTPDLKLRAPRIGGFIPFSQGDWNLK